MFIGARQAYSTFSAEQKKSIGSTLWNIIVLGIHATLGGFICKEIGRSHMELEASKAAFDVIPKNAVVNPELLVKVVSAFNAKENPTSDNAALIGAGLGFCCGAGLLLFSHCRSQRRKQAAKAQQNQAASSSAEMGRRTMPS